MVENIRTVVAMGTVKESLNIYARELSALTKKLKREALVTGILYGITEMVMLLIWALASDDNSAPAPPPSLLYPVRMCSRTLIGCSTFCFFFPRRSIALVSSLSLSAVGCYLLYMLTCAQR